VFTSEEAAKERAVRISQIVKTILLIDPNGDVILAILPDAKELGVKAIKKYTGHRDFRFMDRAGME
jgi:prolyl-tRNA editing enzyme YbaK/EbsC (Cys-tRNA(Pro) deacylase)